MKYTLLIFCICMTANTYSQEISQLSDNFESSQSLTNWQQLEIDGWASKWRKIEIDENKKQLIIEPKSSGWYEDNFGGSLYKEITGNFIITTKVKPESISGGLPETYFSLAGIFIRTPKKVTANTWQLGEENWVFYSVGTATDPEKPQFELKTTYQSISTLKVLPAKEKWVELRIVRQGEILSLFHKFENEQWVLLDQFIRPDFPKTLQVGITAYSDWSTVAKLYPDYKTYNEGKSLEDHADLRAYFDYIHFERFNKVSPPHIASIVGQQLLDRFNK